MTTRTRRTEVMLWTGQILLAGLFAFAGLAKLSMPAELLAAQSGLPGVFMQFIAWCELVGAAGLVLPCWLRIKPYLTPLAAAGLTVIMIGAVTTSAMTFGISAAAMPFVVGTGTVLIARSRWLAAMAPRSAASSVDSSSSDYCDLPRAVIGQTTSTRSLRVP